MGLWLSFRFQVNKTQPNPYCLRMREINSKSEVGGECLLSPPAIRKPRFSNRGFMLNGSLYMSRYFAMLASGKVPEPAYSEHTTPNYALRPRETRPQALGLPDPCNARKWTSSPQRSSSYESDSDSRLTTHDEHNRYPDNTPPLVSAISAALDIHSATLTVFWKTRDALHVLRTYLRGDSKRCLVTQPEESLIAHIVQRASSPDQLSLYVNASWHTTFDADKWQLLPDLQRLGSSSPVHSTHFLLSNVTLAVIDGGSKLAGLDLDAIH
ncbi:hypothetical protein BGY98DRAFT_539328 [Russula aff. rugulosa BPL654]|nr:hypothetical protein BGY98DRAFT_539328 [Russula aff. rugulosa BPL654]